MSEWICKEQPRNPSLKLYGVVLAPFDNTTSVYDRRQQVATVCGDEAKTLLGGLLQLDDWLASDSTSDGDDGDDVVA